MAKQTKILGRNDLLTRGKLKTELVDLGDGESVYVREMTGREKNQFEQSCMKQVKKGDKTEFIPTLDDFKAKLAVFTCCDGAGMNLFEANDFQKLSMNISAAKLERIIIIAEKLNKISDADKEDMLKN